MAPPRDNSASYQAPTWVKASLIVGLSVALLAVALMLLGHGPDQHMPEEAAPYPIIDAPQEVGRPSS
jgi:hypothetical protein